MLHLIPALTLNTLDQHMVVIKGGTFYMGGESSFDDAKPIHAVTLSDFALCRFQVTQQLYEAVTGENPSYFLGKQRPVEMVSWNECKAFIQALNQRTGRGYRLPTEAEWEFAARGGRYSNNSEYAGNQLLEEVGWFGDNSGGETNSVGQLRPNELGLFDLSGNVYEWSQDWYASDYFVSSPDRNPQGPSYGYRRVFCGGSWSRSASRCRIANRRSSHPGRRHYGLGFRLARSL